VRKTRPLALLAGAALAAFAALVPQAASAEPLKIIYSDWPGWVPWEIAIQKKWDKEAGLDLQFLWMDYVAGMDAFAAGQADGVSITNGDALVVGAKSGKPSTAIIINDYSNGNDMVIGGPGIEKLADLKGKKMGVEVGFVSHLLLLNALKAAKLTEKDIQVVNVPTDQTPQALKSASVDAIVAWQPNSGQALRDVAGSKAIFTSANVPGIIYDVLAVNPKSLAERRADWEKVAGVWFQIADYIKEEKNRSEVLEIMSARVGLSPDQYAGLMGGTFFLGAEGNAKHYKPGDTLESIFHSSQVVDGFNMENGVYKVSQKPDAYLSVDFISGLTKKVAAPAVGE
jgi:NitT/TauT family transport system substrate-binding protein